MSSSQMYEVPELVISLSFFSLSSFSIIILWDHRISFFFIDLASFLYNIFLLGVYLDQNSNAWLCVMILQLSFKTVKKNTF